MRRAGIVAALLLCAGGGAWAGRAPCEPVQRAGEIPQRKFAEDLKACRGKRFDIVLLGDSVTEFWGMTNPKLGAGEGDGWINMGIGGDRTQHLLWRLENGALDGYETKFFALMIGVNNFYQPAIDENRDCDRPQDVAEAIRLILDRILAKHPESKILLMPILPYGFDSRYFKALEVRRCIDAVNDRIIDYVDDTHVCWIELREAFLNEDGSCKTACYKAGTYDAVGHCLHPSNAAYETIITPAICAAMLNGVAKPSTGPARKAIENRKARERTARAMSGDWRAQPLSADGHEIRTNGTRIAAENVVWTFGQETVSPLPAGVERGGEFARLLTHGRWILAGEHKVALKNLEPGAAYLVQIIGYRGVPEYSRGHVWIKGTYRDEISIRVGGTGWPCGGMLAGTVTADSAGRCEITLCTDDIAAINAIRVFHPSK